MDAKLQRELDRFDASVGIEAARTPPSSWYRDGLVFARERERVFHRTWQFAARAEQLRDPGAYVSGSIAGEPWVLVRGEDRVLRGFFNVCSHHATQVVDGTGSLEKLVCPYHGWTYDLEGKLRGAPRMAGVTDFDREELGLTPIAVEEWGPLVLINLQLDAAPFAAQHPVLGQRLAKVGVDSLVHVHRRSDAIRCNWKVYVDNYLDGGYHVAHLHHGLAAQLDLDSYRTEIFESSSIQTCRSEGEDARVGWGALYAWVYPNLMLNRYGRFLDTNLVLPTGPESCLVVCDYWLDSSGLDDPDAFFARALEASAQVQVEDVGICEAVQAGLASRAYDQGRYAPRVEQGEFHFHRLLAADLRAVNGRPS